MRRRNTCLLVVVAAAILLSLAFAGVFVYYPITVALSPTSPPVIFEKGSNADKDDLVGSITVNIGANKTSLAITVHPTYQATYYKNISIIRNTNNKIYYVTLKVVDPIDGLPPGSKAILYIFEKDASRALSGWPPGNLEATGSLEYIDLTMSDQSGTVRIEAGRFVEIDLLVYIPEGSQVSGPYSAEVCLIYAPSDETPPMP